MIYPLIRPVLHALGAEDAHRLTLRALALGAGALWPAGRSPECLGIEVFGLRFLNPIGIAAGFDKDGEVAGALLGLGFGFVEVGTVTPRPQAGNPRPRIFRLSEDEAVINRLGFNNKGAEALARRLSRHRPKGILGINIGANKDSADWVGDYVAAFKTVAPYTDYITVNVSSPNTPGLRGLQEAARLEELVRALQLARSTAARALPLLVKLAPDLDAMAHAAVVDAAARVKVDGLIISNTTLARPDLRSTRANEAGGLSGRPLFARSTEMLRETYRLTGGKIPLVGVGGIASARDAYAKIRAGASLVQLYTGLIYRGPGLVRRIREGLATLLKADGFTHVAEAVGADASGAGQQSQGAL